MAPKKKSKWPPSGWDVDDRITPNGRHYKCYINNKTGEKVYSKAAVLRCIENGEKSTQGSQSHRTKQHSKTKPENKEMSLVEANDSLNLPRGWTLEWKVRRSGSQKGTKYKTSVDPVTPQISTLKKELPENLDRTIHDDKLSSGKTKNSEDSSKPTIQTKLSSGKMKIVDKRTSNEDLPSGWVKEIRITGSGKRKYSIYFDPVTKLVFQSKLDVLHYVETGEISKRSYRRKTNIIDEKESQVEKTPPTPSSNTKKTSKGGKRKLFTDEGSPANGILVPSITASDNETQSKRITRSSSKAQSVTTGPEPIRSLPGAADSAVRAQRKRNTRSSSKVKSAATCEPSLEQIPLLPEPAMAVQETLPAKPDEQVSSAGAQSKRRTRSSAKVPSASVCEPSSELVLLPEPAMTVQETPARTDGKISSVGAQNKRHTRSSAKVESTSTCEPSSEQILLLPELAKTTQELVAAKPDGQVSAVGTQSKRRSQSSGKVQSASTCEPISEQLLLLPEPAKTTRELVAAKPGGQVSAVGTQSKRRTQSSGKVQSASTCVPISEQLLLLPEPAKTALVPAKLDEQVSAIGAQRKIRTRSSGKVQSASTCEPSSEQILLLPGPDKAPQETVPVKPSGEVSAIEDQSKRSTKSSSKVESSPTREPNLEQIPLLSEPAKTAQETVPEKADGQVSAVGTQRKRRTRSSGKVQSASTCEPSSEQILLLPEPAKTPQETMPVKPDGQVSAIEDQMNISGRLSSKVESSPTSEPNLEKILLFPESVKTADEIVPTKPDDAFPVGAQSRRTRSTKVQYANICEPKLEQMTLLPEPAQVAQEIMTAKHDGEIPSVEVKDMRRTRSTSKVRCTYVFEPSLEQIPSLPQPAQEAPEMVVAKTDGEVPSVGAQSKRRRKSSAQIQPASMHEPNIEQTWLLPEPSTGALEMLPTKPDGAVAGVEAIGSARPKVRGVNRKKNSAVPKEARVRKPRAKKSTINDRKVSNLSSCSSKRLAEVEAEVPVYSIPIEHLHLPIENSDKTNAIPRPDLVPNEPQQSAQTHDEHQQNALTSQQETYWGFDINIPIVLQTQVDSVDKLNYLSPEYIEEIFLEEAAGPPGFSNYPTSKITQSTIDQLFEDSIDSMLDASGPPGFSHYPRAKITQSTIDQLFEDPVDIDMTEKSPEEQPTSEEHKTPNEQHESLPTVKIEESSRNFPILEEPTTLGRNNAQTGSQFCFSTPLWSDPCLEFAFKTLTGALPLDDNVAIQDYMEHQFRTCDQVNNQQSPDIGMSSFSKNDEIKLSPQFPGDAGFIQSNNINSHKPSW